MEPLKRDISYLATFLLNAYTRGVTLEHTHAWAYCDVNSWRQFIVFFLFPFVGCITSKFTKTSVRACVHVYQLSQNKTRRLRFILKLKTILWWRYTIKNGETTIKNWTYRLGNERKFKINTKPNYHFSVIASSVVAHVFVFTWMVLGVSVCVWRS